VINWLWVAPRLMERSRAGNSLTLTEFLAGDRQDRWYPAIIRLSSFAIVFSFLFYIASQFQAAGNAFASAFGLNAATAIAIGAAIIVIYTLLGGFWAVSVTDLVQGLLMVAAAIVLPAAALIATGGPGLLVERLAALQPAGEITLTRNYPGILGLAFILGTLGIGLGYPGQPHVVNRFMALRDHEALRRGRVIALVWAALIYAGMLLLGLCGRVLWPVADGEQIFFEAANQLFPPAIAGLMIAAVLSAIMSTADSQLLVASSSISWDLRRAMRRTEPPKGLAGTRIVVLVVSLLSMLLAIFAPAAIFSRVLFAWHALGSAFGPALVIKLTGRTIRSGAVLASIACGFGLTVLIHLFVPDGPGDWAERLVPLVVAFAVAWVGSRR
jgi:sodium/proline symporter